MPNSYFREFASENFELRVIEKIIKRIHPFLKMVPLTKNPIFVFMIKFFTILTIFFFGAEMLFSQETPAKKDLLERAVENNTLFYTNPEEAFQKAAIILNKAQSEKIQDAEMYAITTQCFYYEANNNFEELLITAKLLFQKATSYQNPVFQTYAKLFLFNAYAFNELDDKAFEELKQGEKIIKNVDNQEAITISAKINLYLTFANYYSLKSDYENQLKYYKLSAHENEKFTDENYKKNFRFLDYSNRASAYFNLNMLDSSEYYIRQSFSVDSGYNRNDIRFTNFLILGQVALKKTDYENALIYFKEAEKIKGYKNHLNNLAFYDNFIETYKKLGDSVKAKEYQIERDSLKLDISENQNKSLHNLLDEQGKNTWGEYIFILAFFLAVMAIIMFIVIRKNRTLAKQEKISKEYLKENTESKNGENYSKLLEMLKKNNPAFMPYFLEVFPDFTSKIFKINPNIIQSDIEFCALLKLKIPTNDIARYKCITLKSVQNKKYYIRKKLNIPKGVDIYNWFSLL